VLRRGASMSVFRHAIRTIGRAPGLGTAAILCIGLGTAATTTVATLVSATLLRPIPFPHADRLVRLWFEEPGVNSRISFAIPEIAEFSRMSSFDAFLGTARVRVVALLNNGAERLRGEGVSSGYFDALGIRASLGRTLTPRDHAAGATPVIVVSHGTWTRHYGSDPGVIGRQFRTERATYTIVGVTQAGFTGTVEDDVVEFFIPIEQYEPQSSITSRMSRQSWVIARLKPGLTARAAQTEAESVHRALVEQLPDTYARMRVRIEPLGENWRENLRTGGGVLFAAAALLLMIAAINVGCLLLARVLDRRRELAICAALGANRRELMLQLFIEAFVLVAAGGALGALAGPWLLDAFLLLSPVALPRYLRLEPDAMTVLLAAGTLAIAGLVAGTVPAMLGRRVNPGDVLRESGRSTLGHAIERRSGMLLMAGETALTLVLLVAGGLLVRSYERLSSLDMGFEREGIARLAVTFNRSDIGSRDRLPTIYERLRRELASVPGVERVGLVAPTLPPWDPDRMRVRFDGLDMQQAPEGLEVGSHIIDAGLLPVLGVRMVAGRNISDADRADTSRVAVVSRSLAVRMGGVERALGREVVFIADGMRMTPSGAFRVVGVAEDVAYDGLAEQDTRRYIQYANAGDPKAARYDIYTPLLQSPQIVVSIGASTQGDPAALIDPLRRRIAAIAPASAVHWTSAMDDEVALEYAPTRFYTVLVAAFSSSALVLTSIGLFALLSHTASRRTNEMGLRLALGASRVSAAALLMRAGLLPVAVGVIMGLAGAAVVVRAMGSLLYGVGSFDVLAFIAATIALLAVAFVAGLMPARRIARVDPLVALRTD
jgi:putative ABC transport system permease protein